MDEAQGGEKGIHRTRCGAAGGGMLIAGAVPEVAGWLRCELGRGMPPGASRSTQGGKGAGLGRPHRPASLCPHCPGFSNTAGGLVSGAVGTEQGLRLSFPLPSVPTSRGAEDAGPRRPAVPSTPLSQDHCGVHHLMRGPQGAHLHGPSCPCQSRGCPQGCSRKF